MRILTSDLSLLILVLEVEAAVKETNACWEVEGWGCTWYWRCAPDDAPGFWEECEEYCVSSEAVVSAIDF